MNIYKKYTLVSAVSIMLMLLTTGCVDLFGRYDRIEGSGNVITTVKEVPAFEGLHLATSGKMYVEYGTKDELKIEAEDNLIEYFQIEVLSGVLKISTRDGYSLKPNQPIKYHVTVRNLNYLGTSSSGDIFAPDIKADDFEINVSSSGDITAGNLEASGLKARIGSSGDVTLKDIVADKLDVGISSSGGFSAGTADTRTFEANISSSGDIQIQVLKTTEITARISSSGDMVIADGSTRKQDIAISSSGDYRAQGLSCDEADIRISSSGDAYVYVNDYLKASLSSSGSVYFKGDPSVVAKERSSGRIRKSD